MDCSFVYVIMCGFGLGFICWIFGAFIRFLVSATSNPSSMNF